MTWTSWFESWESWSCSIISSKTCREALAVSRETDHLSATLLIPTGRVWRVSVLVRQEITDDHS